MHKYKILLKISLLFFLSNCAAPGTALLSPAITGAKTKSLHQASLSLASSLSSNQIIKNHSQEIRIFKQDIFTKMSEIKINKSFYRFNQKLPDIKYNERDPVILLAYVVDKIFISEVFEPEPLP